MEKRFDKKYFDDIWGDDGVHRHYYTESLADRLISKYGKVRFLDIGTGCGNLIQVLREKGCIAYGMDISEYAVENSHGNVVLGDVRDIPFKDNSFDVVHSQGLWDYIPKEDVKKAYAECLRVGKFQEHNIDTILDDAEWTKDFATHESREWWDEQFKTKLNLGCGGMYLDGYINIDLYYPIIDLQHDLTKPLPYKDGTIDEIYASHIIEHFSRDEWKEIKKDWYRVLKTGGLLHIECPELSVCIKNYLDKKPFAEDDYWLQTIYGSQAEQSDGQFHKNGFTYESLKKELEFGFKDFEECRELEHNLDLICKKF